MVFCITILSLCFIEVVLDKLIPEKTMERIINKMCE